jgi:hypothetical protein
MNGRVGVRSRIDTPCRMMSLSVRSCNRNEMSKPTPREMQGCLDRSFADSPALRDFAEVYSREPIVLYTGAGVSSGFKKVVSGTEREFGLPG